MAKLEISDYRVIGEGPARAECQVTLPDGQVKDLWFEVSEGPLNLTLDALVAVALLPAMKLGADLVLDGLVSQRLLMEGVPEIVKLHRIWARDQWSDDYPLFHSTAVHAAAEEGGVGTGGVGSFFSGGVDSSFTLKEHLSEITHLIYLHNWEGSFEDEDAKVAVANVREVAEHFGKKLIEVRTNAKDAFSPFVSWHHYHGSLLAAVALLLAPKLGRVLIPSSHDLSQLFPWGSHPLLDKRFSTSVEIVHDRVDVTRLEKVASISTSDVLLQHLRVCWDTRFNCGRCSKCQRTILALQALDRYRPDDSFNRPPMSVGEVARIDLRESQTHKYFHEIADYLTEQGKAPELVAALEVAESGKFHRGIGRLRRGDVKARLRTSLVRRATQ
jgi:hypothetical protein